MKFSAALLGLGFGLVVWLGTAPLGALFAQETPAPDLARRLGCFACHAAGPGPAAASLEGVGSRLSREQLQVALTQPRRLHPGARMPSYAYLPDGRTPGPGGFPGSLK